MFTHTKHDQPAVSFSCSPSYEQGQWARPSCWSTLDIQCDQEINFLFCKANKIWGLFTTENNLADTKYRGTDFFFKDIEKNIHTNSCSVGKESACDVGDPGLIPGSGRSPREGNSYPLQYSCLENSTDKEAWCTTVHGVTKSRTWLSNFH